MRLKIWSILRFTVAVALGLSSACLAGPPTVRLAHAPHDHHAALYVAALSPDYFKSRGVYLKEITFKKSYQVVKGGQVVGELQIDSSSGGSEIIRKLAEDQYDMAFGGFPAMIMAIDEGGPIKIIAPVMSGGSSLIISNATKIATWEQFVAHLRNPASRQLRIGHQALGSVQSLALERALSAEGIKTSTNIDDKEAKAIIVNLNGPKNLVNSMKGKIVDGIIAMQPYAAAVQNEGTGRLVAVLEDFRDKSGSGLYPCCALAARDEFVANNADLARTLLQLFMDANSLLARDPAKASAAVARWLGEKEEVENISLGTIQFLSAIDESWQRGAKTWLGEMAATGKLKGRVKAALDRGDPGAVIYNADLLPGNAAGK